MLYWIGIKLKKYILDFFKLPTAQFNTMLKCSLLILSLAINAGNVFCQQEKPTTSHVKTRYLLETLFTLTGKRTDTLHYEELNAKQRALITRFYRNNKVYAIATVEFDEKDLTRVMKFDNVNSPPSKIQYFYDRRGLIVQTINHNYLKTSEGIIKETFADTSMQTYDSKGNKISTDTRNARIECIYDDQNRLIRHDFYLYKKDKKFQRDVYRYNNNLLMEMLGYWYDGKVYKHQLYQYNAGGDVSSSSDSTTNWLQLKQFVYGSAGRLVSETHDKTSQNKQSHTIIDYTYTPDGKIATRTIHSDDPLLSETILLKSQVPAAAKPPYNLREIYTYDNYGNRLKIITELDDKTVKVLDFVMTYYQ